MNDYELKQQQRRERYHELAEKARDESRRAHESAHKEIKGITPGQPILIGHHSEQRHKSALQRHDTKMRKSIALEHKAEHYDQKASSVGLAGISSDDPDAINKLKSKLEKAEQKQRFMREMNKIIRKYKDSPEATTQLVKRAHELEVSDFNAQHASKLLTPDCFNGVGFAPFTLTNNNANIRRMRKRIATLEKQTNRESKRTTYNGVTLVENVEANRVQLIFDGKPRAEIRQLLKRWGFRWSPTANAWQRHLNANGIYAAQYIVKQLVSNPQ